MKFLNKIGLTLLIFVNVFCAMPQVASAQGFTDIDATVDVATVGVAETGLPSKESIQMTDEQQSQYNQWMVGTCHELEVGESIVIGSTADGGVITMTCISSDTDLTRASKKTSTKTYNINHTMAGVETLVIVVDLECTWYPNGEAGYISNLRGTYTIKNKLWSCKWDENNKTSTNYYHALWLEMTYLGSTYSRLFTASYDPFNSTLSFGTAP